MYALQTAVIYAFGAFVVLAGVALLLQWLTSYVTPVLALNLSQLSAGLTTDSRACLLGFLTLGTLRWNITGMGAMRLARQRKRAARATPKPAPLPAPRRVVPAAARYAPPPARAVKLNPYFAENWAPV